MNDRIRELAEQAGFQYIKDEGIGWAGNHNASLPKFAELIVKECCQKLENDGMVEVAMEIKEHFGIEESKGYQPTGWVCPKCGTDRTKAACPRGRGAATDGSCPMFGVAQ